MKKIFATIFIVSAVFAVVGCSSSDPADEKGAPVDATKDAATAKEGGSAPAATKD